MYNYSEDEKNILKVLKMQEYDLENLSDSILETNEEIRSMTKEVNNLFRLKGMDISETLNDHVYDTEDKISVSNIPLWEDIVRRADNEVNYQPIIECFLSQNEIDYTLEEIESVKEEFDKCTSLNKKDVSFLIIATILQTLRWVIINKICGNLGESINPDERLSHDDEQIKDKVDERNRKFQDKFWEKRKDKENPHGTSSKGYPTWQEILWSSVPFDTTVKASAFGETMEGGYHRYKTIGHDPILGWIFGTANIITDTITLTNWNSYRISRVNPINPLKKTAPFFKEPTNLPTIFYQTFDSIREDHLRLPAAVFAEFVHLESDKSTKLGLPVPLLGAFSEDLAGKLYHSQYDALCLLRDIKTAGYQAVVSIIINMLITLIHGCFYNPEIDGDRERYEVRTRKILLYSNSMASAGNIAFSAATQDWGKLDVGGIIVTITRLFSDIKFITKVKKEFIEKGVNEKLFSELDNIDSYFNHMKDPKTELFKRYKSVSLLLSAIGKTIIQPATSVVDNLIKGKDSDSKSLAKALIAGGAAYGASKVRGAIGTSTLITAGAKLGTTASRLAAGATATALGGPIVWTIVGAGALTATVYGIIKKVRSQKKEDYEKDVLLKQIIAKQQAIIKELSKQNQLNKMEIQNLKEALQMLKETEIQIQSDFVCA